MRAALVLTAGLFAGLAACKSHEKATEPEKKPAAAPAGKMSVVGPVPEPLYYWDGAMHATPHPLGCGNRDWHDHVHTTACGHVFQDGHWWIPGASTNAAAPETASR